MTVLKNILICTTTYFMLNFFVIGPNDIAVVRAKDFKGKSLEAVYLMSYKNKTTGEARSFEVVRCNEEMKHHFMSEFHLVERVAQSSKLIYYPIGWENTKQISEKELKEDCSKIVSGKMLPVSIE